MSEERGRMPALTPLGRLVGRWNLKRIAELLQTLWNLIWLGLLLVLVRQNLHTSKYFASTSDISDLNKLRVFLAAEWDTLILSMVCLLTYFFLMRDSKKWREQAEKCFSVQAMPRRAWKLVRGRWVIVWVVMSNIAIFFGLAWFTDNVMAFSVLFLIHHMNAVFLVALV